MKTAIFTASFNRPDLMEELLNGLAENTEDLNGIDIYHSSTVDPVQSRTRSRTSSTNPVFLTHLSFNVKKIMG